MLPRRLILEHFWLVLEGLSLRFLGPEEEEALREIYLLGHQSLAIGQEKETLQQVKNQIAAEFQQPGADRVLLQQRGSEIKTKLETLEFSHRELEKRLRELESKIPNLPAEDVPIGRKTWEMRNICDHDLDYVGYVSYKQSLLRLLHSYWQQYHSV
jgi:seryl-tRNA synthetase